MMRVLIIDKTAGLDASHERHQAIARQPGVELHVLGPVHWIENSRKVHWQSPEDTIYQVHRGKMFFKDYYARAGYYGGLRQAIRETRPHIIQLLEEPWSVSAAQTLLMARFLAPKAKILFYTWENIFRPWKYPSRLSFLYKRIDRRVQRYSSGAVCATDGAKDVLLQKGYKKPIDVIPYGIPHFFFDEPKIQPTASPQFTIGYVGRLIHMKGIDLLLHALQQLADCRLLLVGSGPDEAVYKERSRMLNIENRVEWIPSVPEHEIPKYLRRMDIFVLPSRRVESWQEQLGRAIIEAMAAGVPVIGSSSGAIPEVVSEDGLIFQENSLEGLLECIQQLKENETLRQHYAQAGKERARAYFTWQRFAVQLIKFYHTLYLIDLHAE